MDRGARKKDGARHAKEWMLTARPFEIVQFAGLDFEYETDTLDDLRTEGWNIPRSHDPDFSLGFWKQVKGGQPIDTAIGSDFTS